MLLSNVNDSGWPGPASPGGDRVGAVPARPRVTTTRRTTLGGALLGLGAVTGCDLDPPGKGPTGAGPSVGGDPDTALVEKVLAELTRLTGLVSVVAAKYPRLAPTMADLRALHVAHRTSLGDEPGREVAFGGVLTGADEALTLVRSRERRAQNQLADWAVSAESGALARLLASMSAGVAQRLVLLPSGTTDAEVPG
ncbi:MAG: hypothetical protein JWN22_3463 [Nocardioides sp.]|nr:hypothetical protein [Nocardioides sp.]